MRKSQRATCPRASNSCVKTVSGYSPDGEIVDWIHQQRRLEPGLFHIL
ncbi:MULTISPECIES: hypothetical protein [Gammaproteobacteria]|nr:MULTISPECIES: hypothetical protein [Gammaproteobacteria]MBK5301890.1 hypothetical protein [Bacillus sp. TH86]MBK5321659.1 hypothetical protein [Bacillus sp. TH59]MBK5336609.1 hypothetical protein [Bacillus sp. TH57]MBK5310674.1 hypothetical protein [Pseudomonas sp. TH71]MBK5316156.1 hypothetical protein [Erwinia sp. TH79]